jgi:hypothetical protein
VIMGNRLAFSVLRRCARARDHVIPSR